MIYPPPPHKESRPRFSEREQRLILATVFVAMREAPNDLEWHQLYKRLAVLWDGPDPTAAS
jgi:hypothetical protein